MSEVKWIRMMVNVFRNEKIIELGEEKNGGWLIADWFNILCLAGEYENDGVFATNGTPWTEAKFAKMMMRPVKEVKNALAMYLEKSMMSRDSNGAYCITNWCKYQNFEHLNHVRELNRERQARKRERDKITQEQRDENGESNMRDNNAKSHEKDSYYDDDDNKLFYQSNGLEESNGLVIEPNRSSNVELRLIRRVNKNNNNIAGNHTEVDESLGEMLTPESPRDELVVYATSTLQRLSPNNLEELLSFREELSDEVIIYAIDKANGNGTGAYSYVKAILNRYVQLNVKTLEQAKSEDEKFKKNGKGDEPWSAADQRSTKYGGMFKHI